ncbi:hypothetical protein D1007_24212 [Hordeum vulgare]|nr:hypothetical protein D1007_24212 [Hordeum vulgare]
MVLVMRQDPCDGREGVIRGDGDDDVKVVSTDAERRTAICDVGRRAVRGGAVMRARKSSPISHSVGDGLFVLESVPDTQAHTAAAGGRIWTYTQDAGTYSLDTRRSSWRKEGDWALPFVGKAEHVPAVCGSEGLCFGFASISGPLCAVDLATATAESPPEVRGVWEEFRLPGDWRGGTSNLVHLGSGKMCIFRFFGTIPSPPMDPSGKKPDRFVVITAVEVGPGCDDGTEIKMVKHRSKRIKFDTLNGHITWVL